MNSDVSDMNDKSGEGPMAESHLGLGEAGGFVAGDHGFGGTGRSAGSRNTVALVLACLLGFGAIGLFAMRHRPADASAQVEAAAQLDRVLAKIGADRAPGRLADEIAVTDALIQGFYDYPSNRQVPLDSLDRNPYLATAALRLVQASTSKEKATKKASQVKELGDVYAQLRLTSVVQGENDSHCMINGEVFRPGDSIANVFMVDEIGRDEVVLMAQDARFVLQI